MIKVNYVRKSLSINELSVNIARSLSKALSFAESRYFNRFGEVAERLNALVLKTSKG